MDMYLTLFVNSLESNQRGIYQSLCVNNKLPINMDKLKEEILQKI